MNKKYNKIFALKRFNIIDKLFITITGSSFVVLALMQEWRAALIMFLLFGIGNWDIFRNKGFKVEIEIPLKERDLWLIKDGESETYCLAATEYEVALLTDKLMNELSVSAEIINKGKVLYFE